MFYKVEYQKRAHQEVEKIFRVLFPEQGLAVREEQIRLCHEMLDTLLGEQIALCDAGISLQAVRDYLGHEYEEMTRQYVDYMPKKLEKASEAYFQEETHSFAAELMKGEFHG